MARKNSASRRARCRVRAAGREHRRRAACRKIGCDGRCRRKGDAPARRRWRRTAHHEAARKNRRKLRREEASWVLAVAWRPPAALRVTGARLWRGTWRWPQPIGRLAERRDRVQCRRHRRNGNECDGHGGSVGNRMTPHFDKYVLSVALRVLHRRAALCPMVSDADTYMVAAHVAYRSCHAAPGNRGLAVDIAASAPRAAPTLCTHIHTAADQWYRHQYGCRAPRLLDVSTKADVPPRRRKDSAANAADAELRAISRAR